MFQRGVKALSSGGSRNLEKAQQLPAKIHKLLPAALVAMGLAGCSHPPPPVAMAPPPPPPVGHTYQVIVDVPEPTRHIRITAEQQQDYQQAFNVIALKSALMVAALTCGQQDQYDQFMTTFQPHVLAEQHVMDAYFQRSGGYYGRSKEDDFITLLANNQSVGGISQGAMFCLNNTAEYKAVLALKTFNDLDNFVTDLPPDAPVVMAASPVVTPLAPQEPSVHVVVVHSHHVHLVRGSSTQSRHYATSGTSHNASKPVDVADTAPTKPLGTPAVEQ
jgi:hypothetical protein